MKRASEEFEANKVVLDLENLTEYMRKNRLIMPI
jgi:hypothetical protein